MIISLAPEFANLPAVEMNRYADAIENLIRLHAQGWHIFVPDRPTIEAIRNLIELSANQRAILEGYILGRHAELAGQARSVKRFVLCVPDGVEQMELDDRAMPVPLLRFADLESCSKSELLVENSLRDGLLYVTLAKMFSRPGAGKLPLHFRTLHGGGSSTPDELVRNSGACPPRLSIVDSDRRCPGGALGDTATRAVAMFAQIDDPLIHLELTPGRSVENLIPHPVAESVLVGDAVAVARLGQMRGMTEIEVINNTPPSEWLSRYISLKKGVKWGDVRKSRADFRAKVADYVRGCGGVVPAHAQDDPSNDNSVILGECAVRLIDHIISKIAHDESAFEAAFQQGFKAHDPDCVLQELLDMIVAFGIGGNRIVGSRGGAEVLAA